MRIEIDVHRTPTGTLAGSAGIPGGARHAFTGVMELVAVLERLLDRDDVASRGG